ncbi:hypothetical protein R1sor_027208 [Riccia sorocarpa]|uniref:Uncharacterized protein n=1 Tax=Riccia sorocarpa TaxID=122646 RepID=A0ABD3GGV0_9MARC
MNKFNRPQRNIARERRLKRTERRKSALTRNAGSSSTRISSNSAISGKKQRKLLKKWRKAQKEALETGLVTMQDIEMIAADGEAGGSEEIHEVKAPKNKRVFNVKRRTKMRLKMASSSKGKSTVEPMASDADGDNMMQ